MARKKRNVFIKENTSTSLSPEFFHEKIFPFVRRGAIYGFELHEEMTEPTIHADESSIIALTSLQSGAIFGLTSGKCGHLFYFSPFYYVVDVGIISKTRVAGGALVETEANQLVGGWHGKDGGGGLFYHNAVLEIGTGQEDFVGTKSPVEHVGLPDKNDGIICLVYNKNGQNVFGLTKPGNKIISFDLKSKKIETIAKIDSNAAPVLALLPDGSLLGGRAEGQLWQCQPENKYVEMLDVYAPCQMGKRYAAGIESLLISSSNLVYGGTSTDGFFFSYDPDKRKIINLGKPNRQSNIRALTEGHDGLIYGIVEEPHGMAHFFFFNPANREFTDLGVITTCIPTYWTAHSIGSMCAGINGEIFLGETDKISHLFVYYPPIARYTNSL